MLAHLHKNGPSLDPTEKTDSLGLSTAKMIRECEVPGEACGKLGVYVCREENVVNYCSDRIAFRSIVLTTRCRLNLFA